MSVHKPHKEYMRGYFLQPAYSVFLNPRQTQPQQGNHHQQSQYNRLQHLHPFHLRNRAHHERKYRPSCTPNRRAEPDRTDMQMLGQQLRTHDDPGWKQGSEEQAKKCDGDGANDEARDEPEDELQGDGYEEVDDDGLAFPIPFGYEAEEDAADGLAGPEARGGDAGGVVSGSALFHHKGKDPAAQGD